MVSLYQAGFCLSARASPLACDASPGVLASRVRANFFVPSALPNLLGGRTGPGRKRRPANGAGARPSSTGAFAPCANVHGGYVCDGGNTGLFAVGDVQFLARIAEVLKMQPRFGTACFLRPEDCSFFGLDLVVGAAVSEKEALAPRISDQDPETVLRSWRAMRPGARRGDAVVPDGRIPACPNVLCAPAPAARRYGGRPLEYRPVSLRAPRTRCGVPPLYPGARGLERIPAALPGKLKDCAVRTSGGALPGSGAGHSSG